MRALRNSAPYTGTSALTLSRQMMYWLPFYDPNYPQFIYASFYLRQTRRQGRLKANLLWCEFQARKQRDLCCRLRGFMLHSLYSVHGAQISLRRQLPNRRIVCLRYTLMLRQYRLTQVLYICILSHIAISLSLSLFLSVFCAACQCFETLFSVLNTCHFLKTLKSLKPLHVSA
jgi:hypothetical protein